MGGKNGFFYADLLIMLSYIFCHNIPFVSVDPKKCDASYTKV
jgi:hypothetical protein